MAPQLQSHSNNLYFMRSFSFEHKYRTINSMKLRGLDIDDLFVLVMLGDDISVTEIGKRLNITQPAVSQRITKIKSITEINPVMRFSRHLKMTSAGKTLAKAALQALNALLRSLPDPFSNGRGDTLVHYIFAKASDRPANEGDNAQAVS